ncbi:MAG: ComF family protein [Lentisphaeria bacterium]|nr:ComF family protein [Lentisphaeria bacterium]NQZ67060.1 ComF family protein [Lentisphaeria bacterium]
MQSILKRIYPELCPICKKSEQKKSACDSCIKKLEFLPRPVCEKCGGFLDNRSSICLDCQSQARAWDSAYSIFIFEGTARESIMRFKYSGDMTMIPYFAECAYKELTRKEQPRIDMVVPVPLHWMKLILRGFNQAEVIATELSRHLNCDTANVLKRRRWTKSQSTLSRTKRRENLKQVFHAKKGIDLSNKHILLVDDVFTTGATLNSCTRVLKRAGAEKVHILTLARR